MFIFEPTKDELLVRFRIDGLLRDIFSIPKKKEASVISCVKVMGQMDITEKRLPQDGRVEIESAERSLKVRISTLPQVFGEKIVMRLFSKNIDLLNLDSLGFSDENKKKFEFMIFPAKRYGPGQRSYRQWKDHHSLCSDEQAQVSREKYSQY